MGVGWWAGGVPMPHPDSHRNLRQTELFGFCREALLPRGPSSPFSLSGPLLFFSAEPRGATHLLLGSSLRHPLTLLLEGCGFLSPDSFSMWDVSSWLPPFLHPTNKCASIAESSAVNHVLLYMNNTREEYTGIYRI